MNIQDAENRRAPSPWMQLNGSEEVPVVPAEPPAWNRKPGHVLLQSVMPAPVEDVEDLVHPPTYSIHGRTFVVPPSIPGCHGWSAVQR